MTMNPFLEKPMNLQDFQPWQKIYPKPYNKREVNPYTKTRIILMNGTEFEANWFSHQFDRHCDNNDLRRELAVTRRMEKQQQMKIAVLKPGDESILEHTISYEQLAVDLTARLAKCEPDCNVKKALDFALLEDFDHLYRYADLLEMETGVKAEELVGCYTEIMPARPTVAHHRYPKDNVRCFVDFQKADLITKLHTMIITPAEQQTMNYYMNVVNLYPTDLGRKLYQEIGLVEEEHVTHYETLIDPRSSWLEMLLMHEYTECYLYYSCYLDETDFCVKSLWEECLNQEIAHLHKAAELLQKYEGKQWQQVIPCGDFPAPLNLGPNIDYVRQVLSDTVQFTSQWDDEYINVADLAPDSDFYWFQSRVNDPVEFAPSHKVIQAIIDKQGQDYRYEVAPNPIIALQDRTADNTDVGRYPMPQGNKGFTCLPK